MEERVLQSYDHYPWRATIVRIAAGLTLGMTVLAGAHGIKAGVETADYFSFSPNSQTTEAQQKHNDSLPHEIKTDFIFTVESLAISALSGAVAIRQYKKIKSEKN